MVSGYTNLHRSAPTLCDPAPQEVTSRGKGDVLAEGRGEAVDAHIHEEAPAASESWRPLLRRGQSKRPPPAGKERPQAGPAAVSEIPCAAHKAPIAANLAVNSRKNPNGVAFVA
jgi:hypothetical protein